MWCAPLIILFVGAFFIATSAHAQSVAEAARKEQARKAKEHHPPQHVYTDDDLKRTQILTPADEAKVEARKKNSPPPAVVPPEKTFDAGSHSGNESLGEIARRYRREKAAREAEEALKKQQPSGFPMKLPANSFAAPKPMMAHPRGFLGMIAPRNRSRRMMTNPLGRGAISTRTPEIVPSPKGREAESTFPPTRNIPSGVASRGRVSPFEPRPLASGRATSVLPERSLVLSEAAHLERVTVKVGDTYWKFAREYLGRGSRWQELLAINPGSSDPRELVAGSEIFVPRHAHALSGSSSHVKVQKGDTLWSIARAHLGSGTAWTCLAHFNLQIHNPDLILPGEMLSLPASCSATP
jgi:nucleoid-associated protein YgaU